MFEEVKPLQKSVCAARGWSCGYPAHIYEIVGQDVWRGVLNVLEGVHVLAWTSDLVNAVCLNVCLIL